MEEIGKYRNYHTFKDDADFDFDSKLAADCDVDVLSSFTSDLKFDFDFEAFYTTVFARIIS